MAARTLPLRFTGTGAEYFRIWIVNLLLTIVTLGIYSAWAKVRRVQYFSRNTTLDGAAFDFHGNPLSILKGRIVALLLLGAYQYAFGLSFFTGIVVFGLLLLVLPHLLRGALRFRLFNTSWRGLHFAFTGTSQGAYAAFIPVMLTVMAPAVVTAMTVRTGPRAPSPWMALFGLLYLAWPLMHAAIKRYQHGHVRFGGLDSAFTLKLRRFYVPYLLVFGMIAAAGFAAAILVPVLAKMGPHLFGLRSPLVIGTLVLAYVAFLSTFPYLQSRLGNLTWSHTRFSGVTIAADMSFRGLFMLHAVNTVLTLLTLGMFRPFAVVRAHRYVLDHLHVSASVDIDALLDENERARVNAVGDGAADFAGLDFAL
jgi:uncharacterized membrane protein YjgN (DUF898 family)